MPEAAAHHKHHGINNAKWWAVPTLQPIKSRAGLTARDGGNAVGLSGTMLAPLPREKQ